MSEEKDWTVVQICTKHRRFKVAGENEWRPFNKEHRLRHLMISVSHAACDVCVRNLIDQAEKEVRQMEGLVHLCYIHRRILRRGKWLKYFGHKPPLRKGEEGVATVCDSCQRARRKNAAYNRGAAERFKGDAK